MTVKELKELLQAPLEDSGALIFHGRAASRFCEEQCHSSYHLCPDKLKDIAGKLRTVLAPSEAELVPNNSSIYKEQQAPYLRITAPLVRVKETHGSSKRKRKENIVYFR